ncbi:MAG: SUMF1/EgtB/PvdO family nonheme iron enzyme [Prevotellaceae bacterium]|jgi:hypothetical protein|nr:SUMF1/EgtB/PvdO family nonheme iron enzyme [Prevotellaceae bacterium]
MKKAFILLLAVMCAGVVFGQPGEKKQKVAIYTDDQSKKGYAEFAGEMLTNAIVKRGTYSAMERTSVFLTQINKEHAYGRSGAVDEKTIASVGKQLGVQFVCAVKIGVMDGQYFISARLVEVETAEISGTARPKTFTGISDIEAACDAVIASMFGERGSSGNSGYAASSTSSSGSKTNGSIYNPDGIEMVYVEGLGSGITAMSGFYIGKYEVTQSQWEAVMGSNPSEFKSPNNPVEKVSWDDAKAFISKLNSMTGGDYRLPTEKEWVYAANEGNRNSSYEYSGSNIIGEVAWYTDNSGAKTHPAGQKKANALGIYDMTGNVWEWCEDCSDSSCSYRVYRGGGWSSTAGRCRVAYRSGDAPSIRSSNLGFRLARSSK